MSAFLDLLEKRRSIYTIGTNSDYTKEEITERIRDVVKQVPTAFNSQTTRVVVLFDEAKDKFWDHIYDVQKDVLEGDVWEMMSRSEEHTSELKSRGHLVCRLLLEKKTAA